MKKTVILAFILAIASSLVSCASAADKSNKSGIEQYNNNNFDEAMKFFNQAISQDNSKKEYYNNQGMTYIRLGKYDNALASFDTALSKDVSDMLAYRGKGITYLNNKEYDKAIEAFNLAISYTGSMVDDLDYDLMKYRAEAEVGKGDYSAAVQTYTSLIQLNVDPVINSIRRGSVFMKAGQLEDAQKDFNAAIKADSKNYSLYVNIYQTLVAYGHQNEAEAFLQAALEITANGNSDKLMRGKIFYLLSQNESAEGEFQAAANNGSEEGILYLARLYEDEERFDEAIALYEQYMAKNEKQSAKVYNQLAICKIKQEDYDSALQMIKQGISLDDGSMIRDLKWNEALVYEYKGDYKTAYDKLKEFGDTYSYDETLMKEMAFLKTR